MSPQSLSRKNCECKSGMALVIVLSLLVVMLGLAVIFLSRVSIERRSAASFAAGTSTRQLSDVAVNQVIGQVRDATTYSDVWASQPGMITTFSADGSGAKAYKLYSASGLILNAPTPSDLDADLPPSAWGALPGLWTDLNAPVNVAGTEIYPILDPLALADGFEVTAAPGATTSRPAPMPVQWLYVLQDGSLTTPTGASATTATWSGAPPELTPTEANPIVGRIAYWTDDETAKINVNTASEGSYWDTPRAGTTQEREFGLSQPVQREFQRYPGHPATTSLSPVFFPGVDNLSVAQHNAIYDVVPRIVGGGSNVGTVAVAPASGALTPDSDRLYATVDEMIFADSATGGLREEQPDAAQITREAVEQSRFFLTTTSQAPELNLFGLPRVAMWPVFRLGADGAPNATRTTAYDRLIAFNSTINGVPYYFQREISDSATHDFDQIQDNRDLYAYLVALMGRQIPGFGGNFSSKYPQDFQQIVTLIFDYIRSTNLYDDNLSPQRDSGLQYTRGRRATGSEYIALPGHGQVVPIQIGTTRGLGRFPTITEVAMQFIATADHSNAASNVAANTTLQSNGAGGRILLTPTQRRVQMALLNEFFSPMMGWTSLSPDFNIRVSGLESLRINGQQLFPGFTPTVWNIQVQDQINRLAQSYAAHGGHMGFDFAMVRNSASDPAYPFISQPVTVSGGTMAFTQTANIVIDIETNESTPQVIQRFEIRFPNNASVPVPSLVTSAVSGVPSASYWGFNHDGNGLSAQGRLDLPGHPNRRRVEMFAQDVIRSVLPSHGDFRHIAANPIPGPGAFVGHRFYAGTGALTHQLTMHQSSFILGRSRFSMVEGIATNAFTTNTNPDFPAFTGGGDLFASARRAWETRDWDTGMSYNMDGPFANKPDEGNTEGLPSDNPYFSGASHVQTGSGPTFFSPNRQVASPVAFGSLPTGIQSGDVWQTLLFRPQPDHPGNDSPHDHLLLDLFWMPVVEPYAISQPFSTAGKINMNFQIRPFTYIERSTGLWGLMKNERVAAIPNSSSLTYKVRDTVASGEFRQPINIPATLSQWRARFQSGQIFRSPSEICALYIVPDSASGITDNSTQGQVNSAMETFWDAHDLTGENLKEGLYGRLYSRLTTQSNSYTVHYKVQALKKVPTTHDALWDESKDQVLGEQRGSTSIERYINPNDSLIPDFRTSLDATPTLSSRYKWRVLNARIFNP